MSKKVKIFAISIIALAIIIFAASRFGSNKIDVSTKNVSPLSSSNGVVPLPNSGGTSSNTSADEFSSLLSNIKSINIDTSLFDNTAYKMLRDFPVSLGSDVVGRVNPFAPVGTDSSSVGQTEDIFVATLQSGKVTSTTAEFGAQVTLVDTSPTSIVFEYGVSDTFGIATNPINVNKNGTTLVTVTNLSPETTYYVRAIAVRGSLTTTGNTTSFTTTKK
jgi:hypothetical protein